MTSLLFDEDVVRRKEGSRLKLGLILENYDNTSDEENESDDDSDDDEQKGKKGHVLVAWYPKGRTEVVPQDQVQLHDRSLMAGDLVQRSSSNSSSGQLGTVKAVHVTCNLQAHSSRQIIFDISSNKVQPITWIYPGTFVSLDCWVGEVEDTTTEIVVALKNGARCALSENAAGKLTDVHDYSVEDSVFGESDGFFPGQTLWGRSTVFKNARWLSGQQPAMAGRSNFRVIVEGVNLTELNVNWQTRGMKDSGGGINDDKTEAPPPDVTGDDVKRVKPLQFFSADRVQVGDKGMYQVCDEDTVSVRAVPKGSPMSYKESANVQSKKLTTLAPHSASKKKGQKSGPVGGGLSKADGLEETGNLKGDQESSRVETDDDMKIGNHDMADRGEMAAPSEAVKDGVSEGQVVDDRSEKKEVSGASDKAAVSGSSAGKDDKPLNERVIRKVPESSEEGSGLAGGDVPSGGVNLAESETTQDHPVGATGQSKQKMSEDAKGYTPEEKHHLRSLVNMTVQFVEEYKNLLDMAQDFQVYFPEASDAVDDAERRVQGFKRTHDRMQEQITRTQRLLELGVGKEESPGGDKKEGMTSGAEVKESSSDSDGGEDGFDSDVSSQSSSDGDRRPKRAANRSKRRKRLNSAKKNKAPLKLGESICVEVTHTHTTVDVEWQDGSMDSNIEASSLTPVDLLEDMHFFPGDFVTKCNESEENSYGVVRSLDYKERTCQVCWISKPNQQRKIPQVISNEEVSIYDLIPHPDFHVNTGDTVVRIAYTSVPEGGGTNDDLPVAGQIISVTAEGMVNITWVNGSQSAVYPQEIYVLEGDGSDGEEEEDSNSDSEDGGESSESGSWETATDKSDGDDDDGNPKVKKEKSGKGDTSEDPLENGVAGSGNPPSDSAGRDGTVKDAGDVNGADGAIGNGDMTIIAARDDVIRYSVVKDDSASKSGTTGDAGIGVSGEPVGTAVMANGATSNGGIRSDVGEVNSEAGNRGDRFRGSEENGQLKEKVNGTSQIEGAVVDENSKNGLRSENTIEGDKIGLDSISNANETCHSKSSGGSMTRGAATISTDKEKPETGAVPKGSKDKGQEPLIGEEKPGLTKDGNREEKSLGGVFTTVETTPKCHHFDFAPSQPTDQKKFMTALRKEVQLLKSSLPPGIWLKGFDDKMHLFSALIEGPADTPYEDCLFYFDGHLPDSYPRKPPIVHFHAFCPGKLNPNLYNEGRICLSLLDTWTGKGSEVWTKKSSLLQLLVSIQGLILNSEPYFNEAGYEKHRGSPHGTENSRMYNETALIKVIQSVTNLVVRPPEIFREETLNYYKDHATRLISRIERWIDQSSEDVESSRPESSDIDSNTTGPPDIGFPLFPLSRGFVLSARQVVANFKARWAEVCPSLGAS